MKRKMEKLFAVLLSLAMLTSVFPLTGIVAFAEGETSGTCGDNLTWSFDRSTGTLTISGTGDMGWGSGIVPDPGEEPFFPDDPGFDFGDQLMGSADTLSDAPNTENAYAPSEYNAPWHDAGLCSYIITVIIEYGVTSIFGFEECYNLENVTIPNSVTSIGGYAFAGCCSLENVTIPDSATYIGDEAFIGCTALTSITIPDSVTKIGGSAFAQCTGLTSIYIPAGVTEIGFRAFGGNAGFEFVTVDENNPNYSSDENGVLYNKDKTELIHYPAGSANTDFTVPDSVTVIGERAFQNCPDLISVTIPGSVTSIGDYAFFYCTGLTSVTIPNSVTSIGGVAFSDCTGLTDITIPDSVTSIGGRAFYNTAFYNNKNNWTDNVLYIGKYLLEADVNISGAYSIKEGTLCIAGGAFYDCGALTGVTIPNSVTSIGSGAFCYCVSLSSIALPNSVTSIGDSAFDNCTALTNVTIPNSVTSIGDWAFYNCTALTSVTLPNSVTRIGDYTFDNCTALKSVTLPNSVTSIGDYAFDNCAALTFLHIPSTVTSIGFYAFDRTFYICSDTNDCYAKIYAQKNSISFRLCSEHGSSNTVSGICGLEGDNVTWALELDAGELVIRGTGKMAAYYENAPWYKYRSYIKTVNIKNGVEDIGNGAFFGCTELISASIPDSVTRIGEHTFYGCTGLTNITIPDSVTGIGWSAFLDCTGLTNVTIPAGVTDIGRSAFCNCAGLTAFTVAPNNPNYINDEYGVLYNKDKTDLVQYPIGNTCTAYIVPDGVTRIESSAFLNCTALADVTVPDGLTYIGDNAFYNTAFYNDESNWTDDVLYIEKYLIRAKASVSGTYIIKDGTACLAYYAFANCDALTGVTIPDSVTNIGDRAFWSCTGLTSVTIPNGVTSIKYGTFLGCTKLTSVAIPDSVTDIEESAFSNCKNLTDMTIPRNMTSIKHWVFYGCSGLAYAHIPSGVTSIDRDAFYKHSSSFYICSTTNDCYAKAYAQANNIEFRLCDGHGLIVRELRADGKYYIDDVAVPAYYGLVEYEGNYYYIKDNARIVQNKTVYVSKTNDLTFPNGDIIQQGNYEFDADGKMMIKQGVRADGKYYINGLAVPAYYGLVEWEGDFYYIKDSGLIVRNRTCYINTTHDLTLPNGNPIQNKYYEFDADGKMLIKQGIWSDGKYYIDGVAVPSYYGLVLWEGDFYYIKDNAQVVRSKTCQVNTLNGLTFPNGDPIKQGGYYEFDADGKMIVKQGIWSDGKYYINGVAVGSYYGLVLWEGDYYYIKDNAQIVRSTNCYVNTTNDLTFPNGDPVPKGYYDFDANGKLVIKQGIQSDGKYYINGVPVPSYYGLVEDGGYYYYIKDNAQIVRSKTVRVNTTNGLTFPDGTPIPKGNYEFDADGRMIY